MQKLIDWVTGKSGILISSVQDQVTDFFIKISLIANLRCKPPQLNGANEF